MSEPHSTGYLVSIAVLILLSAFFSASETAFISLGRHHFQKITEKDKKKERRLDFWFANPNNVLVTALVGNNIVNILAAVLASIFVYRRFNIVSPALVTGVMTFLILVFAEIIPKSFAKKHSEIFAYHLALPVRFFCGFFKPLIMSALLISRGIARLFGGTIESIIPVLTEEDLKAMITAGEEDGLIEEEEKDMIDSIFELGDKMLKEIMTPRVNIISVDEETRLDEVIAVIVKEGYSRIPVYRENIDKITGIVYIKDIVAYVKTENGKNGDAKAGKFMRTAYFVPETKKVSDLMKELQEKKMQMAIVVDEFGGTAGLVTMEDLVEEIVGEISDEYKKDVKELHVLEDGGFLVSGGMEIEKVNEAVGLDMPERKFETIAGFVLDHLGKFPLKGESFFYGGYRFTIQEADSKKVRLVTIKRSIENKNIQEKENG